MGYFIYDEPREPLFDNISKIQRYLNKMDPEHLAYVNLFPSLAVTNYSEYLTSYITKVKPQILSFDMYGFFAGELRPTYFENLETIRNASINNKIPFWAFTLSTPHDQYDMPTQGKISFQLYCDLAYGAKGLQYFTYGFVPNFSILSPIDSIGYKTPLWSMSKLVNNEILNITPILKTLSTEAVYHSSPLPLGTHGLPDNFFVTGTGSVPMVIGYFKDKESTPYIMLVNRDYDQNVSAQISFSDSVESIIEIDKKNGTELPNLEVNSNKCIKISFYPGEGKLFKLVNKISTNSKLSHHYKEIKVFPTLSSDKVYFKFSNSPIRSTITIYNASGALIDIFNINESKFEINISSYNQGLYIIKINSYNNIITKTFFKI